MVPHWAICTSGAEEITTATSPANNGGFTPSPTGGCVGGVPSCELAQLRFVEHRLQELRNPQAMLTKAPSTNDLAQRVR